MASDAVALCGHAAGILMVVKSKQTKIDDVRSAVSSVNSADANILGVVVSDVDKKSKSGYYGQSEEDEHNYYDRYSGTPYRERSIKADIPDVRSDDTAE